MTFMKVYDVLYGHNFLPDLLNTGIPVNQQLVERFSIFLIMEEIYYYYPFIIDETGYFVELIKWKYSSRGVTEEDTTLTKEAEARVVRALREGHVLIISNFDQSLLDFVTPIIRSRYHSAQRHLRDATMKWQNRTLIEMDEASFEEKVIMNGEEIQVHEFFHLVLLYNSKEIDFGQAVFRQVRWDLSRNPLRCSS